ncbi:MULTISPECIES: cytochrome P450 [unclassified Bradyrhizobium]|uniref:cytochrome P450 n=1 Tax=unclassified Bradyrhizobium TaxID=2631580 RepID=UPI00211E747D|nr:MULTISPECIES: cytochrome P450 [unclassified Bradyrhizobium]MDD1534327.1 cytochrome P450 [Bradyrhizobium sp. WBOS8]MDD1584048.1 cytochrome P450 [Bradyrhizobium sp. WBOS4]UUO49570.1 cytochrome P450 [Bradyrhizobium sp. WBOS04]UUO62253.1 cytochrome P450 [Bradyrhizobium sp. WBOS08]
MAVAECPVYDVDLYADDVLRQPYRHYRALRDLGTAVWLPRNGLYAVGRFEDVRAALRNSGLFSSAEGVAANDHVNEMSRGTTLASDAPLHDRLRAIIAAPLLPRALEQIGPEIRREARRLVEDLVSRGRFDAVTDLAQHLPLTIVSKLVGLEDYGRGSMLRWASATFNVLGAMNDRACAAMADVQEMRHYLGGSAVRERLRPGSWGDRIFAAADRGEVEPERCPVLMRDYLGPSLDTTIFATANLILLFGKYPDQWDIVRQDPGLIPGAINEALRLESPIRGFTRHLTDDATIGDVTLPKASRVLLLYASANRDERKWQDPERFDVRRRASDHLGFGNGTHMCAGLHLARLEMTALLEVLVEKVRHFDIGEPVLALNNVLRGLASLPVRVS